MAEADHTLHPQGQEWVSGASISMVIDPCPASIWLLGAVAMCSKARDHDGMHEVKIQWSIQ